MRPNVLMVMADQLKASMLPMWGDKLAKTPHLDGLAADGVVVDEAICNYPACTPARATIHTGRYPHTTRVRANHIHLPDNEITLPMLLRDAGYATALIGKNHVFADGSPRSQFRVGGLALADWPAAAVDLAAFGVTIPAPAPFIDQRTMFDEWFGANHFGPDGPEWADHRAFALQPHVWRNAAGSAVDPFPVERTTSYVLGERGADWVRRNADADKPWFCWLSFPDPHNPYIAPEPYASMYDPADVRLPAYDDLENKPERQRIARRMCGMDNPDESAIRQAITMSYAMVTGIDAAIGRVLDALDETGQRDNTIVVFLTDHGGYLGDHGAWHKAPAFYDCLIRMPLIVSWPGTLAARRAGNGFVEQVDLMPTLLDFAGLQTPPGVQGRSMAGALAGTSAARPEAFAEVGEAGEPVTWSDLPFTPDSPLDDRWFPWDGFQETWIGQGKMIRSGRWRYAWWANGEEELYDVDADPDELANLAAAGEHRELVRDLRDRLLLWAVQSEDQLPVHSSNIYLADAVTGRLPF
jgi:arylsulfatase